MFKRQVALSITVVLTVVGLMGAFGFAQPGDPALYPAGPFERRTVFLIDNGFHSDLALPTDTVLASGGPLAAAVLIQSARAPRPWTVVGWGDARFYTESGFGAARVVDGLRALFWPGNPSVIRVEEMERAPDQVYAPSAVTPIALSQAGVQRLTRRAGRSFLRDGRDAPILAAIGSKEPDAGFFVSIEHFSVLHLCNHWVAGLLSAAGVPVHPVLDTLPWGLKRDLRQTQAAQKT